MKKNCSAPHYSVFYLLFALLFFATNLQLQAQSFNSTGLQGETLLNPTSLDFGPNNKLYVSQQDGTIWEYTVARDNATQGNGSYTVVSSNTINLIQQGVPNHNDDGTTNTLNIRQITGILATGTAETPVLYVTSSDSRIGGKGGGVDSNLDTNSGILSRLTLTANGWENVDLVRGLPRCEENHSTNGMDIFERDGNTYLLLQQGGNTNLGAPSNNFAGTIDTYLSGAMLIINLTQLEQIEADNGGPFVDNRQPTKPSKYIYDLPTLNDPTRADIDNTSPDFPYPVGHPLYNATIDIGDPFGGNNGLNQAITEPNGPVQIFSPGWRNAYDVVITQSGLIFSGDNGGNNNWGGTPIIYNSDGTIKGDQGSTTYNPELGDYVTNDFNEGNTSTVGDALHYVGTTDDPNNTYYAGHPVPTRAFPDLSGVKVFEFDGTDWNLIFDENFGDLLTGVSGYFNNSFDIDDFPDDDRQGEDLAGAISSSEVNILDVVSFSTNGLCEYTATLFGGEHTGDLLSASFNGAINKYKVDASGNLIEKDNAFLSGFGSQPLDVIARGDLDTFPGTIWSATYGANNITVFEPVELGSCPKPNEPGYDPEADSDEDGFKNFDEDAAGTDLCSGGSQPNDNDGDFISDVTDTDDDNDGIPDVADAFPIDPMNGLGTDLPILHPFWNNDPGTGFFGLGFTGLLLNPTTETDYLTQFDTNNMSFGGAGGKATVDAVPEGDALGSLNGQDYGFQFGVNLNSNSDAFTVHTELENPFGGATPIDNQSAGFYIGNGDQDNYLKLVVMDGITNDDGIDGFEIVLEENGVATSTVFDVPDLLPANAIDLYIGVNPASNTAQCYYSTDGGLNLIAVGTSLSLPTSFLDATDDRGLAVGLIATSRDSGAEFTATWDFINILKSEPFVFEEIPDLTRFTGAPDETIDLNEYFEDDQGVGNLTYSIVNNTNTDFVIAIVDNVLTIVFAPAETATEVTIRATDNEGLFVEDTFSIQTTESPVVLYRVNSGGPQIAAIDGSLDWEEDTVANNSVYLQQAGTNTVSPSTVTQFNGAVNQTTTPLSIFDTERFDFTPGAPNMLYGFPVAEEGNYEVRIYLANGFAGTSETGERIFDVNIEGIIYPLLNDLDISGEYGHSTGTVITHVVPVTDGILDISFLHGVIQNPLVNGIEILKVSNNNLPIYVEEIAPQVSFERQDVDGSVDLTAYGGDGNLTFSATNLPPGVQIEPTNGLITGTVTPGAEDGSPYVISITVSDADAILDDDVTIDFVWTIENLSSLRINAGGAMVIATDGGRDWLANPQSEAHSEAKFSVNTGLPFASGIPFDKRDASIPAYIDQSTYAQLFAQERYDEETGEEMEYKIPLLDGDYVVNLYVGNSFDETTEIGDRIFDIEIEGNVVLDGFDPIVTFGHQVGGLLSYPITVVDGEMNIRFIHDVQNPIVNAIELILDDDTYPDLSITSIADQINDINDVINLVVEAAGGNPDEQFTYYLENQPQGITIDPQTGEISGTIGVAAANGGNNADGIHEVALSVTKPGSIPVSINFQWDVTNFSDAWLDKDENEDYTARHENSLVQAGDKFYLLGGRESATTLDIYDFRTDTWENLDDTIPAEFNHFQATEYGGLIWVIGAFKTNTFPDETPADFIWSFNPTTREWIQGPEIPAGRKRGSAGLVVYNDKFYVVAGNTIGHDGGYVNWFDEYDPATEIWTELADAPRARDHAHSAIIGDKLYAVGGRLSGGPGGTFAPVIAEVDVYDFAEGTWSTLPADQNLPTPRAGAATVNYNDNLIVIGGEVENELVYGELTTNALKVTESYDPITMAWTRLADMNHQRHGTQGIVSGNGIFILAGSDQKGGGRQKNLECYGEDTPLGDPSVQATLDLPTGLFIANGTTEELVVEPTNGNVGLLITSIEITGPDAADYNIINGYTGAGFLAPNATRNLSIENIGTSDDSQAVLVINYETGQSVEVNLGNVNDAPEVTNPGEQFNNEGDVVNLPIVATDDITSDLVYSASGLPPVLTIDPSTGVISGTISSGTGIPAYNEENGLVIIEAENLNINPNWNIESSETGFTGSGYLFNTVNSFNTPGNGTITANIRINTPGIYRFQWHNKIGIIDPNGPTTEHNDAWLRFPDADDFYGERGASVIYPNGSGQTPNPNGAGSNGWFKIYANSLDWNWNSKTSDRDPHDIFVQFDNPGVYTMEMSSRSNGHLIDRVALHNVADDYNIGQLFAAPESDVTTGGTGGAAENSPYTVTIDVTDDGEPPLTSTEQFVWYIGNGENQPPVAFAEADVLTGEPILTVNFTGSNSVDDNDNIVSYLWDFGDGTTSAEIDPSHDYTIDGTYPVTLTVTDDAGQSDTATLEITVISPDEAPVAVATATPLSGDAPLEVVFDSSASTDDNGIEAYAWDFGTGVTSTEANPIFIFTTPGIYIVTLTVTDGSDQTSTSELVITVTEVPDASPTALAIATPMSGDAPLEVAFDGTGSTDDIAIASYTWNFGNGDTANGATPTYIYTTPGVYTASLTVTDDAGQTATATVEITVTAVTADAPPTAIAIATPMSGDAPLEVAFDGTGSTDDISIASYTWDFGNGDTANGATPTYIYTTPGIYTASLTVTDDAGQTATATVEITVTDATDASPTAVAIATPVSGNMPLEVTFEGTASTDDNGIVSYAWDFGNGDTGTGAVTTYTYTIPGIYTATLTVIDGSSQTATDTVVITVIDPNNEAPVAIIDANPTSGEAPLPVIFSASNSTDDEGIVSYLWNFADGTTSTQINPVKVFDQEGTYEVTLTVTDTGGISHTTSVIITVTDDIFNEAPVAVATATPITGEAPLLVTFTGSNSTDDIGIVSYDWDFKDGNDSSLADPSHTFQTPGLYEVEFIVRDAEGLTDTIIINITVTGPNGNNAPVAVANATPLSGDAPLEVSFDSSGSTDDNAVTGYSWDFGNGDTSTQANPTYIFTTPGTYIVGLTVSDLEGLTDTDELTIVVNDPDGNIAPVAVAVATPLSGDAPLNVNFDASTSSGDTGIVSYDWDYGNGTTGSGAETSFTFTEPGVYVVTLSVTDENGIVGTDRVTITVNDPTGNRPPVAIAEADVTSGPAPLDVRFTGGNSTDDSGIVSYDWDFGDGVTSDEINPSHIFTLEGVFEVTLTVTDADGESSSSTLTIAVIDEQTGSTILMKIVMDKNPASGMARFVIENAPEDMSIEGIYLYDNAGRLISVNRASDVLAEGYYQIPIASLRDELYHIIILMDNANQELLSTRLIVRNN